jgi:xanthine/uracil permease
MLGLGIAQTLVYAGLFYLVSSLVVRLLARVAKPPIVGAIVTAIAIALLSTSMLEIYYTPISSSRMHSSLFHVFR